jgi:release factor glutamine methyltransferase
MLALKSGVDGLNAIREIIKDVPVSMNPDAWLILEHGYDQKDAIQELLQDRGFQKIETQLDYAKLDRITLGQWP